MNLYRNFTTQEQIDLEYNFSLTVPDVKTGAISSPSIALLPGAISIARWMSAMDQPWMRRSTQRAKNGELLRLGWVGGVSKKLEKYSG
jgi:hypothetical protein